MEWQQIETAPKDGTAFLAFGGEQDFYEPDFDGKRPSDFSVIWWADEIGVWSFCCYDSGYYGEWHDPLDAPTATTREGIGDAPTDARRKAHDKR